MKETEFVLLPGLDGTGLLFDPFINAAPPGAHCTVVSFPMQTASYEDALAQVIAAIGDRAVIIVGESFSGPLALMAATALPAQVQGVVLVASFLTCPIPRFLIPPHGILAAILRNVPARLRSWASLGVGADPTRVDMFERAVSSVPANTLAARIGAIARVDAAQDLERCIAPILYLQGTNDRIVSQRSLDSIMRARPSTKVARLEALHLILLTRPKESWDAIQEFLEKPTG